MFVIEAETERNHDPSGDITLLGNDTTACCETPVSDTPRAPYRPMRVCFDRLVVIDDVGNRQSYPNPLTAGMHIETRQGRRYVKGAA